MFLFCDRQDKYNKKYGIQHLNNAYVCLRARNASLELIMSNGDIGTLKSLVSDETSYARFYNSTQRIVNVIWLNFSGEPVKYSTLHPKQYVDINTYVNHLWIIQDERTGDRLLANKEYVFNVQSWEKLQKNQVLPKRLLQTSEYLNRRARLIVIIHLPLYTLRDCAMLAVRNCIKSLDDVKQLELPNTISDELYNMVLKKQTYRNGDTLVV